MALTRSAPRAALRRARRGRARLRWPHPARAGRGPGRAQASQARRRGTRARERAHDRARQLRPTAAAAAAAARAAAAWGDAASSAGHEPAAGRNRAVGRGAPAPGSRIVKRRAGLRFGLRSHERRTGRRAQGRTSLRSHARAGSRSSQTGGVTKPDVTKPVDVAEPAQANDDTLAGVAMPDKTEHEVAEAAETATPAETPGPGTFNRTIHRRPHARRDLQLGRQHLLHVLGRNDRNRDANRPISLQFHGRAANSWKTGRVAKCWPHRRPTPGSSGSATPCRGRTPAWRQAESNSDFKFYQTQVANFSIDERYHHRFLTFRPYRRGC